MISLVRRASRLPFRLVALALFLAISHASTAVALGCDHDASGAITRSASVSGFVAAARLVAAQPGAPTDLDCGLCLCNCGCGHSQATLMQVVLTYAPPRSAPAAALEAVFTRPHDPAPALRLRPPLV